MADRPLRFATDAELETALRGLGDAIAWPSSGSVGGADGLTSRVPSGFASRGGPRHTCAWGAGRGHTSFVGPPDARWSSP